MGNTYECEANLAPERDLRIPANPCGDRFLQHTGPGHTPGTQTWANWDRAQVTVQDDGVFVVTYPGRRSNLETTLKEARDIVAILEWIKAGQGSEGERKKWKDREKE